MTDKDRMVILVTGGNGQLGHNVINELTGRGYDVIGSDIYDEGKTIQKYIPLDITDQKQVFTVMKDIQPDAVVHCAAWTDVDGAESEENKSIVHAINVIGTENISLAAKTVDAKMMYISTDYVFNGQGETPWNPDDKKYAPLNYYGRTKLEGEQAVAKYLEKYYIVRTAWVFGLKGKNFVSTMAKLGKSHDEIRVVNDQTGTPTYTADLAILISDMIETDKYGYYHATNEGGYISWYDFACEIFRQSGTDVKVIPVTTKEYGYSIAVRPYNSRLDKRKLIENGFDPLPDWRDALGRYLKEAQL